MEVRGLGTHTRRGEGMGFRKRAKQSQLHDGRNAWIRVLREANGKTSGVVSLGVLGGSSRELPQDMTVGYKRWLT
jgi:hypothetical protein